MVSTFVLGHGSAKFDKTMLSDSEYRNHNLIRDFCEDHKIDFRMWNTTAFFQNDKYTMRCRIWDVFNYPGWVIDKLKSEFKLEVVGKWKTIESL